MYMNIITMYNVCIVVLQYRPNQVLSLFDFIETILSYISYYRIFM